MCFNGLPRNCEILQLVKKNASDPNSFPKKSREIIIYKLWAEKTNAEK